MSFSSLIGFFAGCFLYFVVAGDVSVALAQELVPIRGNSFPSAKRESEKQPDREKKEIQGLSIDLLVANMQKKQWRQRRINAMQTIARHANRPLDHLKIYKAALSEEDSSVRATVVQCLGIVVDRFPGEFDRILPHVESMLDDPHPQVLTQTTRVLSKIGPPAKSSLPKLQKLAENSAAKVVALDAAFARLDVSAGSESHVQYLVAFLERYPSHVPLDHVNQYRNTDSAPQVASALIQAVRDLADSPNVDPAASAGIQATIIRLHLPRCPAYRGRITNEGRRPDFIEQETCGTEKGD